MYMARRGTTARRIPACMSSYAYLRACAAFDRLHSIGFRLLDHFVVGGRPAGRLEIEVTSACEAHIPARPSIAPHRRPTSDGARVARPPHAAAAGRDAAETTAIYATGLAARVAAAKNENA